MIESSDVRIAFLLKRYAEIGMAQDVAAPENLNRKFNRLFKELMAVEQELRAMPGDQRRLLMQFYDHANWQVRLNAANATLAVGPIEARRQLEAIATSNHFPQAGDAGMAVVNLDRGIYRPQ